MWFDGLFRRDWPNQPAGKTEARREHEGGKSPEGEAAVLRARSLHRRPKKLFNSSLEGNMRRAIDLREGEKIAASAALAQRAAKKK